MKKPIDSRPLSLETLAVHADLAEVLAAGVDGQGVEGEGPGPRVVRLLHGGMVPIRCILGQSN